MDLDGVSVERTIAGLARVVEVCLDREGLTIQKYRVLNHLARRPAATTTELSARLLVRMPVVTKLVDGLVDLGLVERAIKEEDRRCKILILTPAGTAILKRIEAGICTALDHIAESMTVSERQRANTGVALWGAAMAQVNPNFARNRADPSQPTAAMLVATI